MFRLFSTLALLAAAAVGCSAPAVAPAGKPAADRHVILISVDGLAAYYLDDPKARMPTIRRLAREGASAASMICSFPTVTWPNHTTLVTGVNPAKHGVIGNDWWDRAAGASVQLIMDPKLDKDEIVRTPTVYDAAKAAGLTTAGIIWPATRNAKSLDWTMPDMGDGDLFRKYSTPGLMEELRAEGLPADMQAAWVKGKLGVQRDWLYAQAAVHVIKKHKPNLLMLHLIEVDHIEHQFGPRTPEAYWACSHADDRVRDVIEAVEAAGLRDSTTVLVVSDHGFQPVAKQLLVNVLLRKEGLVTVADGKIAKRSVALVPEGGAAFVYFLDKDKAAEHLALLKPKFEALEGVQKVFVPKDYADLGFPTPERDAHAPDLVLAAKAGYSFAAGATGDDVVVPALETYRGTHGHWNLDPNLHGTFVAWGAGIKAGVKLESVQNVDVAPIILHRLGLRIADLDGKLHPEILTDGKP